MSSVLQTWVQDLPLMQQSVLISSVRGADGLHKAHPSKNVLRWLRRCVLVSAFDGRSLTSPTEAGGGSFTGPLPGSTALVEYAEGFTDPQAAYDLAVVEQAFKAYMGCLDESPLHFHKHVMHAAQIIGVHHPIEWIRESWYGFYEMCVHDMHLNPELPSEMNRRLGDNEKNWKAREAI